MGKAKIGKDVTERGSSIISTPKESEEFERWKEEQKEEKTKSQVAIKSEMPEEPEPTPDELVKERFELQQEVAKAKLEGKLKVPKLEEEE